MNRKRKLTNRHSGRRIAKVGISGEIPEHDHLVVFPHGTALVASILCDRFVLYCFGLRGLPRLIGMPSDTRGTGAGIFLGSNSQISENVVG